MPAQPKLSVAFSAAGPAGDVPTYAAAASGWPRRRKISPALCAYAVGAGDLIVLMTVGLGIAWGMLGRQELGAGHGYIAAHVLTAVLGLVAAQKLRLYTPAALLDPLGNVPRLVIAWTTAIVLLALTVFLLEAAPQIAQRWLVLWYAGGLAGFVAFRVLVAAVLKPWKRKGWLDRRVAIYGTGPDCKALVDALQATGTVRVCGLFDDRGADRLGMPVIRFGRVGGLDDLVSFARSADIDLIILSLPVAAESRLLQVLGRLAILPVDIRVSAHASRLRWNPRTYSWLGEVPLIDVTDRPLSDLDRLLKATFDRVVASLALVAFAPVMLLLAAAVKLDSRGPVLFRQKRLGFNNELIDVLKFRSMYHDRCDAHACKLVTRHDDRVTRVGRLMRKTSLDELPQLFNVLIGDLSLVGPRPHAPQARAAGQIYHDLVDGYFARHKVKPGITGWAQINGWRGETDTTEKIRKRVAHDLHYIENWSLPLDLYILLKTPLALFKTDSAY